MSSLLRGAMSPYRSPIFANALSPGAASPGTQGTKRRRLALPPGMSCGSKRRAVGAATPQARRASEEEELTAEPLPFSVLADGPYFVPGGLASHEPGGVASWLTALDLARTDATCRLLRSLNAQQQGPWQSVGDAAFYGMELDVGGGFLPFEGDSSLRTKMQRGRQNWKRRYQLFHEEVPTFSSPFRGREIKVVEHPDEVAYCRCRIRPDRLEARSDRGVYVEVEIRANADNLSLAVVDFEGGGRSSVTFSPETGAVLRERKVRESPRAIEGTYIHLLPAAPPGHRFEGAMGIYLHKGRLAFFRRWFAPPAAASAPGENGDGEDDSAMEDAAEGARASVVPAISSAAAALGSPPADGVVEEPPAWETTGFCTDLSWASGQRLSLCLAFRDDGPYNVHLARVGRSPPIPAPLTKAAFQDSEWNHLYGDDDHPLAI